MVTTMRELWEKHHCDDKAKKRTSSVGYRGGDSPMLAQLKASSHGGEEEGETGAASKPKEGGSVYAAQKMLVKKHYEAKSRLAGISGIGGGVSLWPAMDDMRLSQSDSFQLSLVCVMLVMATVTVFYSMHGKSCSCGSTVAYSTPPFLLRLPSSLTPHHLSLGDHVSKLQQYSSQLRSFSSQHPLSATADQELFSRQLLTWHTDFLQLLTSVHHSFDVVWHQCSIFDAAFIVSYIVCPT